jgi:carbon-monoxide dehydrogenase medium subunit
MSAFKDFVLPRSLAEARDALRALGPDGMPVAGATSLCFLRQKEPKVAVDLSRIGLAGIRAAEGGFAIGAMTTIAALREYAGDGWALDRVARRFVTEQIRNQSTLGGNIARVFAWCDFPVALLALDAAIAIASDPPRAVKADEFFAGQPARLLGPGDLIESARVPALRAGEGFGYRKHVRVEADFSQATAAAWLRVEDGRIAGARVALGASIPMPIRLPAVEQALVGRRGAESLFKEAAANIGERTWRSVAGFKPDYIAHLARVATADALADAWREAIRTA